MTGRDELSVIEDFYTEKLRESAHSVGGPKLAPDYPVDLLERLPKSAVGSSFGCGNPLSFADVAMGDTVVDVGSGAGLDLLIAAERTGPTGHVIGVDMNGSMISRAQQSVSDAGHDHVEVRQGTIEALPIEKQTADWVISNCVVNLSSDKASVFKEIVRVLKPGGRSLISDLVAERLPSWLSEHSDLYAACISGAIKEEEYIELAKGAGLDDVKVVDRFQYDEDMVRVLIEKELPIAIETLSTRLEVPVNKLLDELAGQLSGKIKSIKLAGRRTV